MMQVRSERPSAVIFQFPVGGRAAWHERDLRGSAESKAETPVVCTDAWYHQVALEDEKVGNC